MKNIKLRKQSWKTIVTCLCIIVVYYIMTGLVNGQYISSVLKGLLVPICAYAILAISLNLVVGILGELSIGHAGFMYIGAFTGAFFTKVTQATISDELLRFVLGLIVGTLFAALFGLIIGFVVLRLQGDYLAIVTLAFGEIIKSVLSTMYIAADSKGLHFSINSATALINKGVSADDIIVQGPQGITGIPRTSCFGIGIILLILTVLIVMNLCDSRTGRAIKAVRDNKIAAETVGINISKYRIFVFTVSSALAGLAGVLYAHNTATLQSSKFSFNTSVDILVMVVLGGIGSIPGSIIAAAVLLILPEKLRFLNDYRMIIYAVVLIVMMIITWNPTCVKYREIITSKLSFKKNKKEAE